MNNSIQLRMLNAVYACMLPVARLLLRSASHISSLSCGEASFVLEAANDPDSRGRPTNTSRIAVKTGLSRKDVKRLRDLLTAEPMPSKGFAADQSGPPARVCMLGMSTDVSSEETESLAISSFKMTRRDFLPWSVL